ncbi:MAG TPA: DUF58 domain-containing protein [Pirellulales bacterium]|jgi:uncharacterized protein (DUF58 family)|nr:DUF58 domain-containing protein [Pirellulales bacterium]
MTRTIIEFRPSPLAHFRGETEPSRQAGAGAWLARLLTRQYLPWTERYIGWLRHPLTLLVLADAACAVCGAVLHPNGFLLFAAVTSMIVLGLVWPWLSLLGIAGEVSFAARRGREQQACDVVLRLANRCPWPAWGLALEAVLDQGVAAAVDCVPGWRRSEYVWRLTPTRRGVYPRGTPVLTTSFPFGLWQARRRLRRANQIVVWPTPLGSGALGRPHGEERFDGEASLSRPGLGGDLLGLRPYQRGDSLRRIHWGKSAQLDRLVTCERQRLVRLQAQLVVDTHPDSRGEPIDIQEWVIRAAAGVACGLIEQGAEITMVVAGRLVRLPASDARRAMLDLLAQLEADECPALANVLVLSPVRRFQGQSQIVVTTASAYERLPSAARAQGRRRYVVLNTSCEKGDRNLLPERPEGCFAQKVPVPFFAAGGDDSSLEGTFCG